MLFACLVEVGAGDHVVMKKGILVLTLVGGLSFGVAADAALTKGGDASVKFHATATGGMKIDGTTPDLTVKDDGKVVRISVPLEHLTTGMSLRDKHMKEALQVDKFPNASFAVLRTDLTFPDKGKSVTAEVPGTLNVHGVGKSSKIKYTATFDGDKYTITTSFKVDMGKHDIERPKYAGLTVNNDVDVDASFSLKP